MTQLASAKFNDTHEFHAAYAELRGMILEAKGYARDAKNVRIASGCVVLQADYGHAWINVTSDSLREMERRVKGARHVYRLVTAPGLI
jgi:hypothetical protein